MPLGVHDRMEDYFPVCGSIRRQQQPYSAAPWLLCTSVKLELDSTRMTFRSKTAPRYRQPPAAWRLSWILQNIALTHPLARSMLCA